MVQHILPKGFQRIRYYGFHSNPRYTQMRNLIRLILPVDCPDDPKGFRVLPRKKFRKLFKESYGRDPRKCSNCGNIMELESIWHPLYGFIIDVLHDNEYFDTGWTELWKITNKNNVGKIMIFRLAGQANGIRTIVVPANAECGLKISLSTPSLSMTRQISTHLLSAMRKRLCNGHYKQSSYCLTELTKKQKEILTRLEAGTISRVENLTGFAGTFSLSRQALWTAAALRRF